MGPSDVTEFVLGADLGGTNVRVALAPLTGGVASEVEASTARGDGVAVVAQLAGLARDLADSGNVEWARVAAMGAGVPGVVPSGGGGIDLAPNVPALGDLDVAGALADELRVPVTLDNDVNVATLAEHRHGRAAGMRDFVFISVGTGVGMGVVADGALRRGATGAAGEVGFLPLGADPFDPANQVHGPLEEAAGGVGVARRYAAVTGIDAERLSALDVYARAAAGDAQADAVLEEQVRAMALAVVAVHSVLDPELVVFGGGIGSREQFADRVRAHVARLTRRAPRIEASVLGERAGLLGALALARDTASETARQGTIGATS